MVDRSQKSPRFRARSCTGKVKYGTERESLNALLAMVEYWGDPDMVHRLHTYRCCFCGAFHLGRRLKDHAQDSRRRWQYAAEKRRRRALWDSSVEPKSAFQLWYDQAIFKYEQRPAGDPPGVSCVLSLAGHC